MRAPLISRRRSPVPVLALLALLSTPGRAQAPSVDPTITTPRQAFGFDLGDDYHLANYQQLARYWETLDRESPRMALESIGQSEEGRPLIMAIVTSPENHRRLGQIRDISRRLALAQDVTTEAQARILAQDGAPVVWIDGGLHASEVLVAQQLMETVYRMVAWQDPETLRVLDRVVLLFNCPNPDGLDLVADWYMRESDPHKRSTAWLPRLYQKYTGHDNNRDFFAITQRETEALCRVFFQEWFPQIVYNHHQTGPEGTVLFAPPFRAPHNHNLDPMMPVLIDQVGATMHHRFVFEQKPGATMRGGAPYSTWWNGGLRTTVYYHNIIGLLTETIGHPTPMKIPLRIDRQMSTADLPYPIAPRDWHFRDSVEYSWTANRAVMDYAARQDETLLLSIWRMARNSIEAGETDSWTVRPDTLAAARVREQVLKRARQPHQDRGSAPEELSEPDSGQTVFQDVFRDPARRNPRAYVVPIEQADFPTAVAFINTLIKSGVAVHRATGALAVDGHVFGAGSYVVSCAQAFRPHILDMFEPQVHPDDPLYPGGPPAAPYDSAGWTLAFQMGVSHHRTFSPVTGPLELCAAAATAPSTPIGASPNGWWLDPRENRTHAAVQRLLAQGIPVRRARTGSAGGSGPGFLVPPGPAHEAALRSIAESDGLNALPLPAASVPSEGVENLVLTRTALLDVYGGSMPSGWIRWVLERFHFPYTVVYPADIGDPDFADRFDALILPDGTTPAWPGSSGPARVPRRLPDPEDIPVEHHHRISAFDTDATIPALRHFLERGGSILAIGDATSVAGHLGLPVENALLHIGPKGSVEPLPTTEFFVPGSLLRMAVDPSHPLGFGLPGEVDVSFQKSPTFRLLADPSQATASVAGWFPRPELRSGWAHGLHHLRHTAGVLDIPVGAGSVLLFGPEVTFRAQPHGTFKFLFNGLVEAGRRRAR